MDLWKSKKISEEEINIVPAGLYDICEYFIEKYPEDIFVNEPKEIIEIRKQAKKILEKRGKQK